MGAFAGGLLPGTSLPFVKLSGPRWAQVFELRPSNPDDQQRVDLLIVTWAG